MLFLSLRFGFYTDLFANADGEGAEDGLEKIHRLHPRLAERGRQATDAGLRKPKKLVDDLAQARQCPTPRHSPLFT